MNYSYYGGNRIINMIISIFGYRTCRHFGDRWSHGGKRCWCIISKKYKLPFRFESSVGRYCEPCGLEMDILKEDDYRDDVIVKQELLTQIRKVWNPILVFDDRQRVVDMWRSEGLICCQVARGDF